MKVVFALAVLALIGAVAADQAFTNCIVNLRGDPSGFCTGCRSKYSSSSTKLQTCYNCLVNHRDTPTAGDSDDCYDAADDGNIPSSIYAACGSSGSTTSFTNCMNCLTNFKMANDIVMDLCKMVEPLMPSSLETTTFNCLSNTAGATSGPFIRNGVTYGLSTSPCFTCTTLDCLYCVTNFKGNAAGQAKCATCPSGSNFWSCVYSK